MRILLVEDERDLAEPIARALEHAGHDVSHAADLSQARRAMAGALDLVILDVMLPEGEDAGFELVRELEARRFPGRILCLTARDSVADRLEALQLGVSDYLLKPFSLKELLSRVDALAPA